MKKDQAAMLTLEQINAIEDRAPIDVPVPEWGGSVQIRALTLQQINECSKRAQDPKRGNEIHVEKRNGWYLVEALISPQITIEVAEAWLTERAAGPVVEILGAILLASGLSERAKDEATKSPEVGPAT